MKKLLAAAGLSLLAACQIVTIGPDGNVVAEAQEPVTITPATSGIGALLVAERKAQGLGPMEESPLLSRVAEAHAKDMLARGYFGHENPEGQSAWQRGTAAGYCSFVISENLGAGDITQAGMVAEWMASSGHRKNILDPRFARYGFARVEDYWVLMLAAAC